MVKQILTLLILVDVMVLAGCDEPLDNDNTVDQPTSYSVRSIYWTHLTDADHDGYASSGNINVEVDLGRNVSRELEVRLFYKGANETVWTFVTEKRVTITGNNTDPVRFNGVASGFYYGQYDFRLIIAAWDGSSLLYYSEIKPEDNPILNNQKFEYGQEDLRPEP